VERGGALFLHDQAEFHGLDETDNLNAIAERLDLAFRFNDDEVTDDASNAGASFDVLTSAYDPGLFGV
ncbi:MAG: nuclease, partial [Halalkalicoccus sp.]|nr:nuclease [Halalkalicoccus sp.]